jgi:hypothetical protein
MAEIQMAEIPIAGTGMAEERMAKILAAEILMLDNGDFIFIDFWYGETCHSILVDESGVLF